MAGNLGIDHDYHDRGIKLKQTIRCTLGAVLTRILQEICTQQMLNRFQWKTLEILRTTENKEISTKTLTIIICSMIDFMIEIKEKHERRQKRTISLRKIYTITHTPKFFQPMVLNSKFYTLSGHFSWATVELIFHSKHLAIERNILNFLWSIFSALDVYLGGGGRPCAWKLSDSSTSSKKNVLKAFINIMFYRKQECDLPKDVTIKG